MSEKHDVEVEQGTIFEYSPDEDLDDPHPENELPEKEIHKVVHVGESEINTIRTDVESNTQFGWGSLPEDVEVVNDE